jgi:glycosyltransferase involved in cell wall biosynthesis
MSEATTSPTNPPADPPLVTFALFAYNHEKYIREADEGAFAQTYENLETILLDDCSTDRTIEIMREMAAQVNGPHNVILNRMETQCLLPAISKKRKLFPKWEAKMWQRRPYRMWRLWR